jgi:hypothetical protein
MQQESMPCAADQSSNTVNPSHLMPFYLHS